MVKEHLTFLHVSLFPRSYIFFQKVGVVKIVVDQMATIVDNCDFFATILLGVTTTCG